MSAIKAAHQKYLQKKNQEEILFQEKLKNKKKEQELKKEAALCEEENNKVLQKTIQNQKLTRWENEKPGNKYFKFLCQLMEEKEIQDAILKKIELNGIKNHIILTQYISRGTCGQHWEYATHQFYINSQFDENGIHYQLFQNPEMYQYEIQLGDFTNCKIYVKSYWWFDLFFVLPFCYQYVSIVLDTTNVQE